VTGRDRSLRGSWIPWIPLAVVLAIALGVGATGSTGPTTNADRVIEIAKTIRCPVCAGETVAESNVDMSRTIRIDIADRVQKGERDDDIRAFYATQYGEDAILIPTSSGVTGLVWVTPVVALVVSLGGLTLAFRRWSEHAPVATTDADRDIVRAAQAGRAADPTADTAVDPTAHPRRLDHG